ncbi:MAG TPA: recombinase RecD [Gammaproteobacteria bacterium]|nr:recombinase RecD [Gammaproteobacteria bacterium]
MSIDRPTIEECWIGIVSTITFHNPTNGWTVLKVNPVDAPQTLETVVVHQSKVFAGVTLEFKGAWIIDSRFGRQFKASQAIEKKPASAASLEKYLGSGLIKGVGPKTAQKIVRHFKGDTLEVFDDDIDRLVEVPGIADKKLSSIAVAWKEHKAIRDVMMFLQEQGISTLFAVRIYKTYGDDAIAKVKANPYCLADDIYGIGFFSADRVALTMGLSEDSPVRLRAAMKHVLAASREQGHCYLTMAQIQTDVLALITLDIEESLPQYLQEMTREHQLCTREILLHDTTVTGYYSKSLYYAETYMANALLQFNQPLQEADEKALRCWIEHDCKAHHLTLSGEQTASVIGIAQQQVAILTGGPGCGKTTTTQVIVRLLESLDKKVTLVAPTGRAAQRMSEVIGREAKTIHRLLEWRGGEFQVNEFDPLKTDCLIIDECSMLDITLASSLMKAVPEGCQVLFIGDADQLPSVGAGNVLKDMIASNAIPCYRLTQIFRQVQSSSIIRFAHQINKGEIPPITSPFKHPDAWSRGVDCLFFDSDETTAAQLRFVQKVKHHFKRLGLEDHEPENPYEFRLEEQIKSSYESEFEVPERFEHVDLDRVRQASSEADELKAILKKIHPWSSLHYNLTAVDVVVKLALHWIPKYLGQRTEVQILTPMVRGSLGSANLNDVMQAQANPPDVNKSEIRIGQRTLREGDRVIHRKNNYDLNVYNGDIGEIISIDLNELTADVKFMTDCRIVHYKREDLMALDLAYAITIHKSQGSEFESVVIPVLTQHFKMLYRNLIYTALTRGKKFAGFVGTRRAMGMAIRNQDTSLRQTALRELLHVEVPEGIHDEP